MPLSNIDDAVEDIKNGKMIIIVDDEDRENEGDLVCAAEKVTPEIVNFLATNGRGLICLPLTEERCNYLQLPPMTAENTSRMGTAFTVSIEAREGVTTGISAADRAHTILTAVDPASKPSDLARPGHIFPLRSKDGGVLVRTGQTEASVDMARLAGLNPAAVICEIMNDDGTMARRPQLEVFAQKHGLKIISVADLVRYRLKRESLVKKVIETALPTHYGSFRVVIYENILTHETHIAMAMGGNWNDEKPPLVRIQTENVTFAMLGSILGESSVSVKLSLEKIAEEGRGIMLYLRQKDHNVNLVRQVETYALMQEKNMDFQAAKKVSGYGENRDYGVGAQILHDLGVKKMRLLTNHPPQVKAIDAFDLEIVESIPL